MESIFVVLFLLSVGVSVGLWQRKQFWKEEYYACLRDALREEVEDGRLQRSGSFVD
jgi:hypothetical protein